MSQLTVNYILSGTAINGTDYQSRSGSVIIPQGATTADVTIIPIDDASYEGTETAVLTLSSSTLPNGYNLNSAATSQARVSIADNETTTVNVSATDANAAEPGAFEAAGTGTFLFTRSATGSGSQIINFSITGSASWPADYDVSFNPPCEDFLWGGTGSITIPAGLTSRSVIITPKLDSLDEPAETLIVTIQANSHTSSGRPLPRQ